MRMTVKVKCPGCRLGDSMVRFVAPGFMSSSNGAFTCDICESDVAVVFARTQDQRNFKDKRTFEEKKKGVGSGPQVRISSRVIRASEKLVALLEEERQSKAVSTEAVNEEMRPDG